MKSRRHQAGNMSHVHHQIGAHLVGDLPEFLKVDDPGVSAGSGYNHFRLSLQGDAAHLLIVDNAVVINPVGHDLKICSGDIGGASVGQMSAVGQVHAHHRVPGL